MDVLNLKIFKLSGNKSDRMTAEGEFISFI